MVAQHYRWDFIGLSTDDKPTPATSEKVVDGSTFYCSDTSKLYVFCKDQWYEKTATGGGGGGTSDFDEIPNRPKYAGSEMTSQTNIPDVTTKQDTLVAGTNIKNINGSSLLGSGSLSVNLNSVLGSGNTASNRTATFTNGANASTGVFPDVLVTRSNDNKYQNILRPDSFTLKYIDTTTNPQDPTDSKEIGHDFYMMGGDIYVEKKEMQFGDYYNYSGIFSPSHVNFSSYNIADPESPVPMNHISIEWGEIADVSMSEGMKDAFNRAITVDSGWTTLNTGLTYRKLNGVVYVNIAKTGLSLGSTTASNLGTLPDGFRPALAMTFVGLGTAQTLNVSIATNGAISAKTMTSTDTACSITFSFPVG